MKVSRQNIAVALPVVYLLLTILVAGEDVVWFYALSSVLVIGVAGLLYKVNLTRYQLIGHVLITLASVGLAASTLLTIEKISILENPDYVASCSVSPVVSCNNIIASEQASAINGIPNPLFGIFAYTALIVAGMAILAGAKKLHKNFWYMLFAGVVAGVGGSIWLIYQGLYDIGSLCLYCMAVWFVTFALLWFVLEFMVQQKLFRLPRLLTNIILRNRNLLITASIGVVILLIYFRWAKYWNSLV